MRNRDDRVADGGEGLQRQTTHGLRQCGKFYSAGNALNNRRSIKTLKCLATLIAAARHSPAPLTAASRSASSGPDGAIHDWNDHYLLGPGQSAKIGTATI